MTLEEAKLHLKVDFPDDDVHILNLISAAREWAEDAYSFAFLTQTWRMVLDRFPLSDRTERWPRSGFPWGAILLPRSPLQSVSAITYYDANNNPVTVPSNTYMVDIYNKPGRIALNATQSWPSVQLASMVGVQVDFIAGFADPDHVPFRLKQALLLIIGHWYQNREEVAIDQRIAKVETPLAARDLLGQELPPMVG